jgi:3-isopropylmalate/(R)-2-methylmalate dehydratase large subunit
MARNLLEKVWELHKVATLPSGQDQVFVGLHLIHEVTSPQAFQMLRERGLTVLYPERTIATVDHIVPTDSRTRPLADPQAEEMMRAIEDNTRGHGIRFFGLGSAEQGIVHIIGPELGLTQPGAIIACGDSHTSTHGAFGALAFGIGTSQIRDVLATQTLALSKPKVRRISVDGILNRWVYAKDIILRLIAELGVKGGIGYAYEYGGSAIESLGMEARLTVCNMSIEGGARVGYVNPDEITYRYIEGRKFAPKGEELARAVKFWKSIASEPGASYDDEFHLNAAGLAPMVAWGINPGQAVSVTESLPRPADVRGEDRETLRKAYEHTGFTEGTPVEGLKIDVAFLGSCTNGRLSDLREAASVLRGRKVAGRVKALAVPGSVAVAAQAEAEGLDQVFRQAGFQWRTAGCSMCLAMNPDKLIGRQVCASSSNRNFIGRQGSSTGRTLLMSPAMVAAAAVAGEVMDVRKLMGERGEAGRG